MKKTVGGWLIGMLALVGTAMGQDMRDVTFSVDMSVQIGLGNFDPETMGVDVRGDFNSWGQTALTREGETGIYSATISVAGAEADPVGYKFYYNDGGDVWENDPNRSFNLGPADTPQVLDTVYFNNQGPVGPSVTADVTFSVDMSVQIGLGNFDPETMGVDVRGDFNSWGQTALTREGETSIYSALISVTAPDGSAVGYKFFYDNGEATENEIWENDPNRTFVMSEDPQVLDTVYFNNEEPPSGLQLSGTWNPATTGAYEFIVTRSGPEVGDEIQLSVDNELAASVPATVTFAEGDDEAAFDVTVLSLADGNVTVTAEDPVSGDFAEYSIQMPRMEISGLFQVFAAGPASYTLTRFNNISGTVNLSSTNPAVMTVPATATFDGENAETTFQGMALAEGSTTLVATDPVSGVSSEFNVTFAAPSLALHGPDSAWIGTTPTYTLTRSGPIGEVVQLTSSDGAVLQVPETVTFGFEENVVTFQAQALAEGTAQLGAGNADATAAPLDVSVSDLPDYPAYDDASLYAGGVWELSPAHESGFSDWTETLSSETNNSFRGKFIGASAIAPINQGGLAFGLYANWSESEPDPLPEIKMSRAFPAPMAVGQTFSVDVAYDWSSGTKGFKLKGEFEGAAYDRFELFNSGNNTWSYKIDGNDATITVIWDGYIAGGFMGTVQAICTAPNTFTFSFQRGAEETPTLVENVVLPGTIDQVEFYNYNGGAGDAENFYFNRMWLTSPAPALDLTGPWDITATGDYEYTLTRLGAVSDTVHLSSDNEAAVTVPETVTFGAGEETVTFMATVGSLTNGEAVLRAEDPLGTAWSEFTVRPREVGPGVEELVFDPLTGDLSFNLPAGYSLEGLFGADFDLDENGDWDWVELELGTDYTVDGEGRITILTENYSRMILRVMLVND